MTTDTRKTLEACAKVMGYPIYWNDGTEPYSSGVGLIVANHLWNPLTSVADAVEMAIKKKINVKWIENETEICAVAAMTDNVYVRTKNHPSEQLAYCHAVCKVAEQLAEVM